MGLRYLRVKHWLLIVLLGMMGFSSCSKENDNDDDGPHVMYGVPTKTYSPSK